MAKETAILLATYNGGKYLKEQLNSIFSQRYSNFDLIIHDDGSDDNTIKIIDEYMQKYNNIIIMNSPFFHDAKRSFIELLTFSSEKNYEYFAYCDQDDVWKSDKLEKQISILKNNNCNRPFVVFSDMEVVNEKLTTISKSFVSYNKLHPSRLTWKELLFNNPGAGCSMAFNNKLANKIVSIKQIENITMHDHWTLLVASIYGDIFYCEDKLILYRQHESNCVGAQDKSLINLLKTKLFNLGLKKQIVQTREYIDNTRLMATEILKLPNLNEQIERELSQFIEIKNKNKFKRVAFYILKKYKKAERNWWMMLWV